MRATDPTQSHEAAKGACIGPRGERASQAARAAGVRLDLVAWDPDLARFAAAALAPAHIRGVTIQAEPQSGRLTLRAVAADPIQVTLAIGPRARRPRRRVG